MQENIIINIPLLYNEDCITAMEKLINNIEYFNFVSIFMCNH